MQKEMSCKGGPTACGQIHESEGSSKQASRWKDVLEAAVTAIKEKDGEPEGPNYTGNMAKSGGKAFKPPGEEKG